MTISNHMLVGAAIALTVKIPVLVLPLAFASHFLLDVIPHFGVPGGGFSNMFKNKLSHVMVGFTIASTVILLGTPELWTWLTATAAFLAASPDLHWIRRYFVFERRGLEPPDSRFGNWHHNIQWCERPWGFWIEVGFFVVGYLLLIRYLI